MNSHNHNLAYTAQVRRANSSSSLWYSTSSHRDGIKKRCCCTGVWGQTPSVDTHSGLVRDPALRLAADVFARFISMQRRVRTRSCNTSQRCPERRAATEFTTVRKWIELHKLEPNRRWINPKGLFICAGRENATNTILVDEMKENLCESKRELFNSGPCCCLVLKGFNYWWHWLICMKHLLSNVTCAHLESCWVEMTFFSPCE